MNFPNKINMGSGKDFREDFLNLDLHPVWKPDIVYDLNLPFPETDGQVFQTERFGAVAIRKGSFSRIVAHDVLEHMRELVVFMGSCLDLLEVDGLFHILVPHDLSHGAWQDPTHVRAFNERSWMYYTEWFWYLGWSETRFVLDRLEFQLSDYGKALRKKRRSIDEISRTPRAVEAMDVLLRKVRVTEEDWEKMRELVRGKP
jgi:SAM-dependent methyltransferase